jgi:di/tricarboxylate transporter
MSFEIIIVFGLILLAMVLFAMDGISFDLVAMILMSTLMLTGILDVKEGLSGFSNPATVTIAAMFALSKGIQKTGVLRVVSRFLGKVGQWSLPNAALVIMGIIALISAFINNTAAVVIFIPVLMTMATRMDVSPSKMLMPLSFASMFGGVCTLLGTSTNILVSSIAADNGLKPFSMFEFTPFGLIIVVAGFIYLYVLGINMVPPRRETANPEGDFNTVDYLSDIQVTADYAYVGKSLKEVQERWHLDIDAIFICRDGETLSDKDHAELREGDVVRIRGSAKEIDKLIQRRTGLKVRHPIQWENVDVTKFNYELLEAVVAPDSDYDSQKIKSIDFAGKYGAMVLGVYKRGHPEMDALEEISLGGGDSVLLALKEKRIRDLKEDDNFVIVSSVPVTRYATEKVPIALGILVCVVFSAALGLVPIVVSAGMGVILMVLTGCLHTADIHRSINWKVIFLLAGVIPLGIAMQKTGAARLLSELIVERLGYLGPRAVLSGYFLLTTLLTAMISNQATAAILAALAIETANGMGVEARPFLMAVTFAASLSLITPWGYQTNTLIYGPGRYRFTDFTRVGAPLNILFWVLGTVFIPIFWPF